MGEPNTKLTNTGIDFSLTESQEIGCQKIRKWLNVPISKNDINTRIFRLIGKAGTGKSTLIKYALKDMLGDEHSEGVIDNFSFNIFNRPTVIGVTMSHKAKNVLRRSLPYCETYAKYFGLSLQHLPNGEIVFKQSQNKYDKDPLCTVGFSVVVHDEISMYNDEMVKSILERTNSQCKIILMGDRGQLPPVNSDGVDKDSPAFNLELSESSSHELIKRVRQTEDNPIIDMSDIIYEQIFGNLDMQKVMTHIKSNNIKNGIGYEVITYNEFLDSYKNSSKEYKDSKVVAYRKNQVNNFNSEIRKFLHNNPAKIFIAGEIIYMNDTFTYKPSVSSKPLWSCYNSDEYLILDVVESEYNYKPKKVKIPCYDLMIETKEHPHLLKCENPFVRVVAPEGYQTYKEILDSLKRNAIQCSDYNIRGKLWKDYYAFANCFGSVAYGYCFTGYKAQGSTYKTVYVDINDILLTKPITDKRKLQAIYTAVTRASNRVVFLKSG